MIAVIGFVSLLLLVYALLWLPPVQQKVKDVALSVLMERTDNRMSIGKLTFRPFNSLCLEEVYIEDLRGDTLFYAESVSASFHLLRLLDNHLLIQSVDLERFVVNINKDSVDSDFNFRFFIDAFQSDKPDSSPSSMAIQINGIKLKEGRVNYDVLSEPMLADNLFDSNHIHLSHLRANVDLHSIDLNKLNVDVGMLSFKEKSGFVLNELRADVISKNGTISYDLYIRLPRSRIAASNAWVNYSGYSLNLKDNCIVPDDLKMFYPKLEGLNDNLVFSLVAEGSFPRLNISQLRLEYGDCVRLSARASMDNTMQWKSTPLRMNLNYLCAEPQGMQLILDFVSDGDAAEMPVNTGTICLKGTVAGSLPNMVADLKADTERGALFLSGTGGYNVDSGICRFDAKLNTDGFDVSTLLQDTLFGVASLQLLSEGVIMPDGGIHASGDLMVNRFDFNDYTYNQIRADMVYTNDSVCLNLKSEDANVPLSVAGTVNWKGKLSGSLHVNLDSVYLDPLNFLSGYTDAYLSSDVRVDMDGVGAERMGLNLSVENFSLYTNKGSFEEPRLKFSYQAADSSKKQLTVSSRIVNARVNGAFTYAGIQESIMETFPVFFPDVKRRPENKDPFPANVDFFMAVRDANLLSDILELPEEVPDSALFVGKYKNDGETMTLSASAYTQFMESDTLQLSIVLANKNNNLSFIFNVDNKSNLYSIDGTIDAEVAFIPRAGSIVPDMDITLNPTVFVLNETLFDLHPAQIELRDNRYIVRDFLFDHNNTESLSINGVISDSREDSLKVNISKLQLGTVFSTMKTSVPLLGEVNGEIVAKQLLSTPFILSRGFSVNNILVADNAIGDLNVVSAWSTERRGLALRATLTHENHPQSVVSGYFLPEKDSLSLTATIRDMELQWLNSVTAGTLYGLDGSVNADIKMSGSAKDPTIGGVVYFDKAKVGITLLNTMYSINDSIYLSPNLIELKRFTVKDENDRPLTLTGKVPHQRFADFNPDLTMTLSNFQVINNQHQTDSLFYGNLRVNGILKVKRDNRDWLVSGDITHSRDSKVMVNIPSAANTAVRYNSITFVNSQGEDLAVLEKEKKRKESTSFSLPLRINVELSIDPSLTVGAVFNPATGDAAQVTGSGSMNFVYDMNNSSVNLFGGYEVRSGKATLSLVNITTKTFTVKEGGRLTFRGDPLMTTFDVTALYSLRADLTALDPSLENIGLAARVPVDCALTASGDLNKMELKYDILLPNEPDEVQRRVQNLLYTDDLMIKEIAYLLAFGSFMPLNKDNTRSSGDSFWTALASSSITSQLNNLLSGVLDENWSIGADLRTSDAHFNDLGMDVNISTRLFNNRLTVNSTLGYSNDPNQTENFTGDFDAEYKLNPSGNVVLKVYNVTNNQYYEKAKTTQGVGVVYKRSAKTFKGLFDKFRRRK